MPKAKRVKKTGISKEFIFEDYPSHELTEQEEAGYVNLPVQALFPNLVEASQYEDNDPTYSMSGRFPKGDPHGYAQRLFAVIDHVARNTWDDDADERLEEIFGAIGQGVSPKRSPISLQDGDQIRAEYNEGSWVLKASVKEKSGRPRIYSRDGKPIVFDSNGEVIEGNEEEIPEGFDLCVMAIRVWAMKKFDRINFSLEAVRFVGKSPGGVKKISDAKARALLDIPEEDLTALEALVSRGVEEEEEEAPKRIKAKASAKKKTSAKKGRSVFKK